jgi:hypothetical protein
MSPIYVPGKVVLRKDGVAATDTNIREVSLLLHGNGTNGSTTITDSSLTPKTVTAVGNAQISTAQSKFGGASIAFDGSGDYASVTSSSAFDLGISNEPFTVEFWFYRNATGNHAFFGKGGGNANWNTNAGYQYLAFIEAGVLYWMWNENIAQAGPVFISTSTLPAINQWHHYAASYDGTNTKLFINGTQIGSNNSNIYIAPSAANRVRVGAGPVDADLSSLNGYLDDLRITKGIARYTANFTPPTAAFPDF